MLPMMLRTFQLVKAGNAEPEYEDALNGDTERGRFAVADGATESAFAGLWAKILTSGFVAASAGQNARDWLSDRRAQWRQAVPWDSLPWYGREKTRLGSQCAFLALWFAESKAGDELGWRALAVGDCCLFQVRELALLRAFPITRSSDFGNHPQLLGSSPGLKKRMPRGLKGVRGGCRVGDLFVLATDALAHWCLRSVEAGESPWPTLHRLDSQDQFAAWIGELRAGAHIRNDDVSLLILEVRDELARPL